jgi:hypothetical protein
MFRVLTFQETLNLDFRYMWTSIQLYRNYNFCNIKCLYAFIKVAYTKIYRVWYQSIKWIWKLNTYYNSLYYSSFPFLRSPFVCLYFTFSFSFPLFLVILFPSLDVSLKCECIMIFHHVSQYYPWHFTSSCEWTCRYLLAPIGDILADEAFSRSDLLQCLQPEL